MGLRKEFLVHKRKTVESFGFVKADISSVNAEIGSIKNAVSSVEARISSIDNELQNLNKSLQSCFSDINLQHAGNKNIISKIDNISSSVNEISSALNSFGSKVKSVIVKNQEMSRSIVLNAKSTKKLLSRSKAQSLESRKLNSRLKEAQKSILKLRNLFNKDSRTLKNKNEELDKTIRNQRKRIIALNRKIEGKKVKRAKRISPRRLSPKIKKTTRKIITPKKTVIEVKEQKEK